ncbi:MAG: amino acid ABC transporter permease [Bacillota bacterium]
MQNAEAVFSSLPYIGRGIPMTLIITTITLAFGALIGLPLALARVYGNRFWAGLVNTVVQTIRSIPLIVIIFIAFSVLSDLQLPAFVAACLSLAIRSSAYQSELFRGAIQSIGPGQMMAARALGFTRIRAIFHIIIPQALRLAIPSWSNEAAVVLKDSSLAFAVGVLEMMRRADYVRARTGNAILTYALVGIIYFLMTFITNRLLDQLDRRLSVPMEGS